jgi:hypothetical protein
VDVPEDRHAVGSRLIEYRLQDVRHQRRHHRNEHSVVACRRSGSPRPREASHVRARANASEAGSVLRAIAFAIATSTPVGFTVIDTSLLGRRMK